MDARELRIGNFALCERCDGTKVETQAFELKASGTWLSRIGLPITEPIPLTEEWLTRFGFGKREASTCVEWYIGQNEVTHDWLFSITWLTNPELIKAHDAPFYRNGRHTIYYVHQLQNLYFALTGAELELKNAQ